MGNIQWVLFNLSTLPIMGNMGKVLKLIPSNTIFVRQAQKHTIKCGIQCTPETRQLKMACEVSHLRQFFLLL